MMESYRMICSAFMCETGRIIKQPVFLFWKRSSGIKTLKGELFYGKKV
jgi:hypothetical protein